MNGQRGDVVEAAPPALRIADLRVTFRTEDGPVPALRGVDLEVAAGQVLGVVGESGSGKSATMLAAMGLLPPRTEVSGSVQLGGRELLGLPQRELRKVRGRGLGMVFQDPMTSLNPVFTVGRQIAEAIRIHHPDVGRRAALVRAVDLLRSVGIPGAESRIHHYPHQFSGGMRQRVVIAIAMANDPKVLIADEPTTALDVTVQAQILDLLRDLSERRGIAVVLISHDLGVVSGLADHVAVLYGGRVAEVGPSHDVFYRARHPYTRGLLAAVPRVDHRQDELSSIPGAPPSLHRLPPGCAFAPRCGFATDACDAELPHLRATGALRTACIHAERVAGASVPTSEDT